MQDVDGSTYFVFVAGVIPTKKEKTQEGEKYYRLWFVLHSNGSVYSAFCKCKGGADQGCRHLGATLFELDDFLSNQTKSVTSVSAYWNPKPTPNNKPVPLLEMKVSHGHGKRNKRKVTAQDDSWIDSFDPRPMKHSNEITLNEKLEFAKKLTKIDPFLGFLISYQLQKPLMTMMTVSNLNIIFRICLSCPKLKSILRQMLTILQSQTFLMLLTNFLKC